MANLNKGNLGNNSALEQNYKNTSEMTETSSGVLYTPGFPANYDKDDREPCGFVQEYKCPPEPHKCDLGRNKVETGLPPNCEATATHLNNSRRMARE